MANSQRAGRADRTTRARSLQPVQGSANLVVGVFNTANAQNGFIAGGLTRFRGKTARSWAGLDNQANGLYMTVCGGGYNYVTGPASNILSGYNNQEGDWYSAILGGYGKTDQTLTGYIVGPATSLPSTSTTYSRRLRWLRCELSIERVSPAKFRL